MNCLKNLQRCDHVIFGHSKTNNNNKPPVFSGPSRKIEEMEPLIKTNIIIHIFNSRSNDQKYGVTLILTRFSSLSVTYIPHILWILPDASVSLSFLRRQETLALVHIIVKQHVSKQKKRNSSFQW